MEESGELPEGVLSINETALGTIEGGDSLDVAMVMLMWRSTTLSLQYSQSGKADSRTIL